MGDPIPDEFEIGNTCAICDGDCFEPNQTPKYLGAMMYNVKRCVEWITEPANGILFIMRQRDAFPCRYTVTLFIDELWYNVYLDLNHESYFTRLVMNRFGIYTEFESSDANPPCTIELLPKDPTCTDFTIFAGGTAHLFWGEDINETAYLAQNLD